MIDIVFNQGKVTQNKDQDCIKRQSYPFFDIKQKVQNENKEEDKESIEEIRYNGNIDCKLILD